MNWREQQALQAWRGIAETFAKVKAETVARRFECEPWFVLQRVPPLAGVLPVTANGGRQQLDGVRAIDVRDREHR